MITLVEFSESVIQQIYFYCDLLMPLWRKISSTLEIDVTWTSLPFKEIDYVVIIKHKRQN